MKKNTSVEISKAVTTKRIGAARPDSRKIIRGGRERRGISIFEQAESEQLECHGLLAMSKPLSSFGGKISIQLQISRRHEILIQNER